MKLHMKRRQEILDLEAKMHFSADLDGTLTEDEKKVCEILSNMRKLYKND